MLAHEMGELSRPSRQAELRARQRMGDQARRCPRSAHATCVITIAGPLADVHARRSLPDPTMRRARWQQIGDQIDYRPPKRAAAAAGPRPAAIRRRCGGPRARGLVPRPIFLARLERCSA